jgi:hypothetical protein
MTFNSYYQKLKYIDGMKDRLRRFYSISDIKSDHRKMLSHDLDGYMEAGLLTEILDKRELQSIIDEQHIAVFGLTRQERRLETKSNLETAPDNWDKYDTPAIDRR